MSQIFHRSANTIARVSIFGAVFFIAGLLGLFAEVNRSPWVTQARVAREQPLQFSHERHVGGNGIDCRYCHASVERAADAGMPTTHTCMSCHSQVWIGASVLEPLRTSVALGEPIAWTSVHRLPPYVVFHHGAHVAKGVACESCHGRVDEMPRVMKAASLQMRWCLDCHRDPVANIRPREDATMMGWQPPADVAELQRQLALEYHVQSKTDCSTCHR